MTIGLLTKAGEAKLEVYEDTTEEEVNKNVLKFYLHELGLIFNVNYSNFVEGIV